MDLSSIETKHFPYIVGLTGGIGSGKTVASDHFATHGVPIIDTDVLAREIVEPGQPALAALVDAFGTQILDDNKRLDRDILRNLAFASQSNKQTLDSITHPAIRDATLSALSNLNFPYCVIVVPLLMPNSPFTALMQRIVCVQCDQETRIQRVIQRSQLTRDAVLSIMKTQLSDEQRAEFSHDIIDNNGAISQVHEQVDALHKRYLSLAEQVTPT